jgi:hypothetical protein
MKMCGFTWKFNNFFIAQKVSIMVRYSVVTQVLVEDEK